MSPLHLECVVYGRPGLIVHVGAGPEGPGVLAQSARAAILIEPDPDRAAQLRARYGAVASIRLVEAAVVSDAGHGAWGRARVVANSMGGAGAQGLVRDLAAAFEPRVDCIAADQIVTQDDFEGGGENILLIDAASEAETVLEGLETAGWLDRFDHVIVKVREAASNAHITSRVDIAAWAQARSRLMLALPGQAGKDTWRAWIGPARRPAPGAGPALHAPQRQAGEAGELEAALETYRAASREAEARWLEQRGALMQELHASQARCAELEAAAAAGPDGGLERVRREAAEAEAHSRTLREELAAELETARARVLELGRALQKAEEARARAEADLQNARKPVRGREDQEAALRDEAARFQRELDRLHENARAANERERALTAQLTAGREDLRLALTGQRLAQASLSELQSRYSALLDDRNELDGLLRQITDRLSSAALARLGLDGAGAPAEWDN